MHCAAEASDTQAWQAAAAQAVSAPQIHEPLAPSRTEAGAASGLLWVRASCGACRLARATPPVTAVRIGDKRAFKQLCSAAVAQARDDTGETALAVLGDGGLAGGLRVVRPDAR